MSVFQVVVLEPPPEETFTKPKHRALLAKEGGEHKTAWHAASTDLIREEFFPVLGKTDNKLHIPQTILQDDFHQPSF